MSWFVRDRWGNDIVLSDERWRHIIEGHWELASLRDQVLSTIQFGTRKQDPTDLNKYRYSRKFANLPYGYTHIFVIVRLGPTHFVITAYPKRVR